MSSSHSTPTKNYKNVYCHCNFKCPVLTVQKEGKNQGREFYCCSQGQQVGDCKFFRWVENSTCASVSYCRPDNTFEQGRGENLEDVGLTQLLSSLVEKVEYGLKLIDYGLKLMHLVHAVFVVLFLLMICFIIALCDL